MAAGMAAQPPPPLSPPPPFVVGANPAAGLKRQRPDEPAEDDFWQQQCQQQASLSAAAQPPAQRRRLNVAAPPAFGTPQVAPPLPQAGFFPQKPAQGPQQQHAQLKRQPSDDLELGSSGEMEEAGGAAPPPAQRLRTGQPEFRLVLPSPLPPAIPPALLETAALQQAAWSQQAADAWAVVPYAPPLVTAQELERQEQEQREGKVGGGGWGLLEVLRAGCGMWVADPALATSAFTLPHPAPSAAWCPPRPACRSG